MLTLAISAAFVVGSVFTGTVVFADDTLSKLEKRCVSNPDAPRIKFICPLLDLIFVLDDRLN